MHAINIRFAQPRLSIIQSFADVHIPEALRMIYALAIAEPRRPAMVEGDASQNDGLLSKTNPSWWPTVWHRDMYLGTCNC